MALDAFGNNMDDSGYNWRDFTSGSEQSSEGSSSQQSSGSSYSGLPDWFKNMGGSYNLGNVWNNNVKYAGDAWRNALQGGQVNPATQALIEKQRLLMPEQYRNQMELSNARQVQQPLNRMSSRGVLNSSVTGDALAKVLREQSGRQADQYTQANTWAGNELLKGMTANQGQNMDTWKTIMGFLPQLLASIRESTAQNQSSGSSSQESSGNAWGMPNWPGAQE